MLRDGIHGADESSSRVHHDHRGLRQVLRVLRGAIYSWQGAEPYIGVGARRSPPDGRSRLQRDSTARTERELLPRSFWKEIVCRVIGFGRRSFWNSTGSLHNLSSSGFWSRHSRGDRCRAYSLRPRAFARPERVYACPWSDAATVYTGGISRAHHLDESR